MNKTLLAAELFVFACGTPAPTSQVGPSSASVVTGVQDSWPRLGSP
jgi:hypothetical protein